MDKGIFAAVDHRKLMILKNCGAVHPEKLEEKAESSFRAVRRTIIDVRQLEGGKGLTSWFGGIAVDQAVKLMFPAREDLVEHLVAVKDKLPTPLCPVSREDTDRLLFVDRAARYTAEAAKVLDMFRRHHEVIVDSDRSRVIEWVLDNQEEIRKLLEE